jgi:acyl-CoA thioester hydrolase
MTALRLHSEAVRPDWVDYNGHMSEAYYVLVFGHATDALYEHGGAGADYRARTGYSLYTVESHIQFLREISEGALLETETWVLGVDPKRLQFCHQMTSGGTLLATTELMVIHVDTKGGTVVPMASAEQERFKSLTTQERPSWTGRSIKNIGHEKRN